MVKKITEGIAFPNNEMTRYDFISHMEAFMKELLMGHINAPTDDFLMDRGIDARKAIELLLKKANPEDASSSIMIRTEKIRPKEQSEEDIQAGKTPKDEFCVKYQLPRKDYTKKMRNLYIDLFENYEADNDMLNEEDGGANNCNGSSGQYVQPLFGKKNGEENIIRRKIQITEDQLNYIRQHINEDSPCVMDTQAGDFGFDNPPFKKKKDPAYDHQNMMQKSFPGNNN